MRATILIPTFDHGPTLGYALQSALAQTVKDIEIFIVGDGVPAEHRPLLESLARSDPRVRWFDHPKHERRGEPYRHAALQEARGDIVCYLCDRDLYFPDHVAIMSGLLARADFANSFSMHVRPDGGFVFFPVDLGLDAYRVLLLRGRNRVALSSVAHTLDAYRRLPSGWRPTPEGLQTDLYMFQQFLAQPWCRAASGYVPSVLTFASPARRGWTAGQRAAELAQWQPRLATRGSRTGLRVELMTKALRLRDRALARHLDRDAAT